MQTNLDHAIYDAKYGKLENTNLTLNESQIQDILRIVGNRCRQPTKERLVASLRVPLKFWKRYGIYSRLTLTENGANYICGQSWTDEMRTLRNCILHGLVGA